jgi:hypothetical protein
MNSFFEHHKDSIRWHYRCFDRILLNGLIQPFQQPERVVGFFNTYRQIYPVTRSTLRDNRKPVPALGDRTGREASMPARWRSRINRRSISAIMPSTVTRMRPVSVDMQNSGSTTRNPAPFCSNSYTRFRSSRVERPRQSNLTAINSWPARRIRGSPPAHHRQHGSCRSLPRYGQSPAVLRRATWVS